MGSLLGITMINISCYGVYWIQSKNDYKIFRIEDLISAFDSGMNYLRQNKESRYEQKPCICIIYKNQATKTGKSNIFEIKWGDTVFRQQH